MNTTKTLPNIFQHYSIYLLGFFETRPNQVILGPLGEIGFDELMVSNEVAAFGKFVVCSGATLSRNVIVVHMKLS